MTHSTESRRRKLLLVFASFFVISLAAGAAFGLAHPTAAAPAVAAPVEQGPSYAGSESCRECHENIVSAWESTRHAQAFSSPIFQRDWTADGSAISCLECHVTGLNKDTGQYAQAGVTCESCHGPFQSGHPETAMPIKPDADLCATCHKSTTDEWRASPHAAASIDCQSCHNPHSQTPKADSITGLCSNCHKEMGSSFTHGTHSNAGLECSNCHMYTKPRETSPVMGLVSTGHTFVVGSDACIGCHQDTVHTRDSIIKLTGEVKSFTEASPEQLKATISEQEQTIGDLQQTSAVRLYTGLAQGAIVGLVTGAVAAWVVSRRLKVVEVEE